MRESAFAVAFAVVLELPSLAVTAHTTVVLANWSRSPGETNAHRLQRRTP